MRRLIEKDLLHWKNVFDRLPLVIRGARQVGKSYTIEKFGKDHFQTFVTINFEFEPEFKTCFNTLNPHDIIKRVEILSGKRILIGKSLLFFDEIQDCPNAFISLRYFKEKMPELHVIAAGSLLELSMNREEFRMPVGRVQFMYMYPLNFLEFLIASEEAPLLDYIENLPLNSITDKAIHEKALRLFRDYTFVGGLPSVLNIYFKTNSYLEAQKRQSELNTAYKLDFGKYSNKTDIKYIEKVYERLGAMISRPIKYSEISKEYQARDLKRAIVLLEEAKLITKVNQNSAAGLPIKSGQKDRYKLIYLDVGLYLRLLNFDHNDLLLEKDLSLINEGIIAEQIVGQELLSYQNSHNEPVLSYWDREKQGSSAEVDYLYPYRQLILPIEVKAGTTGRLKSIRMYLDEKGLDLGIRVSQNPLSLIDKILSVPFYLISQTDRLVSSALSE